MKIKHITYILCLLAILWSCQSKININNDHSDHDHSHEAHNHEHDTHDHNHDADHVHGEVGSHSDFEDEIIFPVEKAKAVGLEIEEVKMGEFHQVIRTSGQILSAQGDETTVSATSNGLVSFNKTSLSEGAAVRGGEVLLSISSKNLVDGDPIVKAKNAFETAKREFERAESLIADKLISATEYNEIKLNYVNAKESYGAFAKHNTSKGAGVSAPINGFVKTKLVQEGDYVSVGQPLVTITQNKKLKLRADVSERYYNNLSSIVSANFKTPYDDEVYELSALNGRMTSYGRSVANDEYYLPVNFEFNNVGNIISGSYVDVYLLSAQKKNALSIPSTALVEDQGTYYAFVQLDAEGYKKQEVKLGTNNGKRVEILAGLKEGDKIVSKSAIHVKLAASATAIPHAHEH